MNRTTHRAAVTAAAALATVAAGMIVSLPAMAGPIFDATVARPTYSTDGIGRTVATMRNHGNHRITYEVVTVRGRKHSSEYVTVRPGDVKRERRSTVDKTMRVTVRVYDAVEASRKVLPAFTAAMGKKGCWQVPVLATNRTSIAQSFVVEKYTNTSEPEAWILKVPAKSTDYLMVDIDPDKPSTISVGIGGGPIRTWHDVYGDPAAGC